MDTSGKTFAPIVCLLLMKIAAGAAAENRLVSWKTQEARFSLNRNGAFVEFALGDHQQNFLAPGQPAPLLSVRVEGKLHGPSRATWDAPSRRLTLDFAAAGMTAVLRVETKPTHVVYALTEIQPTNRAELVLWGPYPTTIGDIIGETAGVVRGDGFALGIQALNVKTLGGYPARENDTEGGGTADDPGQYSDLPIELGKDQLMRGDTACRTEFGSVLQAYCRSRNHDRVIANWGHAAYLAPAFADGGVVGSSIALFGCAADEALETIGSIELAEGLPHPMLDGVWAKRSPAANASYLIVDFSEATIDRAVEMTRRAGLNYLYHSSPFETWGHFQLKRSLFPHGWEGMRNCVERARKTGVRIGFHTLSNFITPNDPYVTPRPDPRLARIGASVLTADADAEQKEIPVASPVYFQKETDMNTVVIGGELVRYGSVSSEAPWRLLNCRRGSWGTHASPHAAGDVVAKLMDHSYKVFLTDAQLSQEVARNIARFCNETGCRQLSFDGLEGNWSTGMGQYGRSLFTSAWYDALSPDLRGQVINDASNPGHFNWHIYTRMNWGEPWYAGFRESQTLYRFKNQLYFERNLMPRMLGWFALRPDTSIEDAEWLLARAAGFDAGFALAASLASTAQLAADPNSAEAGQLFGTVPAILEAVKQWETARMARAFAPEVKAALRDNACEFHLEAVGEKSWVLRQLHIERLTHELQTKGAKTFRFENAHAGQPLQWLVRNTATQAVTGLTIAINGKSAVDLGDRALPPGGALRYTGGTESVICDSRWHEAGRVPVDAKNTEIGSGQQAIAVACLPQPSGSLKLEFRVLGPGKPLAPNSTTGPAVAPGQ